MVVTVRVGREQEHGGRVEDIGRQIVGVYPHGFARDFNADFGFGVDEVVIRLLPKLRLHAIVGITLLVVVAVFPQHSDANQILVQGVGTFHVRSGQKA